MRIAVTGASGLVGRALCARLAAGGHRVRAIVRRRAAGLQSEAIEQVEAGNLERSVDWSPLLAGTQALVHLAAYAHGRGGADAIQALNIGATVAAGRAAARAGMRFVFLSTIKVHGEESGAAPLDEAAPLDPRDVYARSKAMAEQELRALSGLAPTVLRPPLVYGPGVKANFRLLLTAVARGIPLPFASLDNRRSLVFVGNLADAIACCLDSPQACGRTYLVSDGPPLSTPALCRALGAALDRPARLFPFPEKLLETLPPMRKLTRSLIVDDSAIRAELAWRPPFNLESGLRRTVEGSRRPGR